jgi:4-hydroxybenzoate polyprenyltransferase
MTGMVRAKPGVRHYLSLIRFSHTVFALPFALTGYVLGLHDMGIFWDWKLFTLVLLCMIFARSAAMAFNRYADRAIDAQNVRTRTREIPAGTITPLAALVFVVVSAGCFVLTTWFINPLCFTLSPVALLVILGYSYAKRFTAWSHFILGLGLSLAPVGAYLAVTAAFDMLPCLLAGVVLLWVSGFDVIYALQDEQFDKQMRLHSLPVRFGGRGALRIASGAHVLCALLLLWCVVLMQDRYLSTGWLLIAGTGVFIGMLFYQHRLVSHDDLSRVNLAFFTTNGVASVVFGLACILDLYF